MPPQNSFSAEILDSRVFHSFSQSGIMNKSINKI